MTAAALAPTRYQRMGFGTQAPSLLLDYHKPRNTMRLIASYAPEKVGPGKFHHKFGIVDTGEVDDGENVTILEQLGR